MSPVNFIFSSHFLSETFLLFFPSPKFFFLSLAPCLVFLHLAHSNARLYLNLQIRVHFLFVLKPMPSAFQMHFFSIWVTKFAVTKFAVKANSLSNFVFDFFNIFMSNWSHIFFNSSRSIIIIIIRHWCSTLC